MLLTDTEVTRLKSWLIGKLETISEADSQILSDYVVALLQAESSDESELKANAIENLTDFLGNNTKNFIEEVFGVIKSKRHIRGQAPSSKELKGQNEHRSHASTDFHESAHEDTRKSLGNHKRHYDDFKGGYMDWDAPSNTTGEPSMKQPRRKRAPRVRTGPRSRERLGESNQKGQRQDARVTHLSALQGDAKHNMNPHVQRGAQEMGQNVSMGNTGYIPDLHGRSGFGYTPQGLGFDSGTTNVTVQPFDPNVALQAILTLQAMGFTLPAFPNLPNDSAESPKSSREHESKDVRVRGSSRRFQRQQHEFQVQNEETENTNNDIAPAWDAEAAQKKYEARKALLEQTELKRQELIAKEREIELQKAIEVQKMRDVLTTKGKKLPPDLEESVESDKTKQLLAQLKALEDEAKSLGLDEESWFNDEHSSYSSRSYRGRGTYHRGWSGYPRRGRGYIRGTMPRNGAYNLDNRPKQVKIEDIQLDTAKEEILKQHLLTIGDIDSAETNTDQKSCIVSFRDRHTAEKLYFGSTDIPGIGKVKLSWVTKPSIPSDPARSEDTEMLVQQQDLAGTPVAATASKGGTRLSDHAVQREDDVDYGNEDYEWIV